MKNKLHFLLLIFVITAWSTAYSQLTDRGLIAHYTFETDANNQVSDDFHLTPQTFFGFPLPAYLSEGGRNYVQTYNGTNLINENEFADYLQTAYDKSFSVSFWMRTNNLPQGNTGTYFEAFRSLFLRNKLTQFGVTVGGNQNQIHSGADANSAVFKHYAIVFDSNKGTLTGYINNVFIDEISVVPANNNPPIEISQVGTIFSLGSGYDAQNDPTEFLRADFSDMYVYNRALSSSDIEALYNNETPVEHTLSNDMLLAHYDFEVDGSNSFSNNFNLTPHGTPPGINSGGISGNYADFNGFGSFYNDNEFGEYYAASDNKSFSISLWAWINDTQTNTTLATFAEFFENVFLRGRISAGYKPEGSSWLTLGHTFAHQWTHIVLVVDTENDKLNLYVNNALVSSWHTPPINPIDLSGSFNNRMVIGAGQQGGEINYDPKGFQGHIDEMYVFNRALSHNDVDALFNILEPQTTSFEELSFSVNGGNGSLTAEVDGSEVSSGDQIATNATITFTATPDTGFKVAEWTVNGTSQDTQSNTFVLEGLSDATNVTVSFESIPANTFLVDFSVIGGNGSLTASVNGSAIVPGQAVANGEEIVFTASPNSGYRVMHWLVGGTEVAGNTTNEYVLSNLSANTLVEVEFEIIPIVFYDLTFSAGDNGNLTADVDGQAVNSGEPVQGGKDIEFTATPASGYQVLRWTLNGHILAGETGNSFLLEDVDGDVLVTVSFMEIPLNSDGLLAFYDFEESPENRFSDNFHMSYIGTGTPQYVTGASGQGKAIQFDGNSALINENELRDYFNDATDKSISISFWIKADATATNEMRHYDAFSSFYSQNVFNPGFTISTVDGQSQTIISPSTEIDQEAPGTTLWHFTLSYNAAESRLYLWRNGGAWGGTWGVAWGYIPVDTGGDLMLYNDNFVIGAGMINGLVDFATMGFEGTIDDFYIFNRALTNQDAMDLFNRKAPVIKRTIAFDVTGGGGELSAFLDDLSFDSGYEAIAGETITFTASPEAGFKVEQWVLNGEVLPTQNNTLVIEELTEDITLSVSFETIPANSYLVDFAVLQGNGSLTATVDGTAIVPGQAIADDKDVVFTATPDLEYEILAWYVDGVQVAGETGTEYILSGLSTNVLVEVAFKPIGFVVEFNTTGNGSISAEINSITISSGDVAAIGEDIIFTASPDAGFMLARWSVNGQVVAGEESTTFTFTNIQENITVSASFVPAALNTDGLVAYYNFEETPQNVISDNFHMSYIGTGTPEYVPGVNGEGNAIKFNGNNALENDTELRNFFENSTNKSMTVSYWVKTDGNVVPATGFRTMFEAYTALIARDRLLRVWANTTAFNDINSGVNVDDGSWRHITVVFNSGTSKLALYINGALHQEINTAGHQLTFSNNKFLIGVGMNNGVNFGTSSFAGAFDDFYIYNKALSAAEVFELYEGWDIPEKQTVTFAVNGGNGELDATVNGISFDSGYEVFEGETLLFTATPEPGFRVKQWSVSGGTPLIDDSGSNVSTLEIEVSTDPIVVGVEFEAIPALYTVTFDVVAGQGTLTATADGATITSGDQVEESTEVIFTATPEAGYQIKDWLVDGNSLGITNATYTIASLSANVDVQVEFELIPTPTFAVTFNVAAGQGTLTATADGATITSGDQVEEGTEVIFTATPETGYQIKDWLVDGNSLGITNATYTIASLSANVDVQVEFELIPIPTFAVTFNVAAGQGTLTATADGATITSGNQVEEGSEIIFTATPETGYQIKDWLVDGNSVGATDAIYTITSLNDDVDVQVEFEVIPPQTFEVTFSVLAGQGDLTASVEGTEITSGDLLEEGKEVIFTATPEAGSRIKDWLLNGVSLGATNETYTIANLDANVEVQVEFEAIPTYTITFEVIGSNGTLTATLEGVTFNSGNTALEGESIAFAASPEAGYKVKEWILNGSTVAGNVSNNYLLSNIQENAHVTVEFEEIPANTFMVNFSVFNNTGGVLSAEVDGAPISNGASIPEGSDILFTASPESFYEVENWIVNGVMQNITDNTFTISELNDDVDVMVVFGLTSFTFTFAVAEGEGTISATVNGAEIVSGQDFVAFTEITVSATPNQGYQIKNWWQNGVFMPAQEEIIFNISEDVDLQVEFELIPPQTFDVIFSVAAGQGILNATVDGSAINSGDEVEEGSDIVFTATPAAGYQISDWWLNGSSLGLTDGSYTVSGLSADVNVQVEFVEIVVDPETYTVTFSVADGQGTLSATLNGIAITSGDEIEEGSDIVFTATPAAGYQISDWWLNGSSLGLTDGIYTVSGLSADVDVQVEFEQIVVDPETYTVTFSVADGQGTLSATVNGTAIDSGDEVEEGSDIIFTATPAAGYQISDWWLNGSSLGITDGSYTVSDLSADVNVQVEFEEIVVDPETYTVTFGVADGQGSLTASMNGNAINSGDEVEKGKDIIFTATPDAGFILKEWHLNGSLLTGDDHQPLTVSDFTYENLDQEIHISVVFEEDTSTDVEDIAQFVQLKIYPNPAFDFVKISNKETINKLEIVDVNGRIIKSISVDNSYTLLDISGLPSGFYFLRLYSNEALAIEKINIIRR